MISEYKIKKLQSVNKEESKAQIKRGINGSVKKKLQSFSFNPAQSNPFDFFAKNKPQSKFQYIGPKQREGILHSLFEEDKILFTAICSSVVSKPIVRRRSLFNQILSGYQKAMFLNIKYWESEVMEAIKTGAPRARVLESIKILVDKNGFPG